MKTYGLTGGVGMGKSTVATILAERGVAVADTDELARQVVRPGEPALAEIRSAFGAAAFNPTGELDRGALADIIFRDTKPRQVLEAILHPRIRQLWQARLEAWRQAGQTCAAVVIPLLFETAAESEFNIVICVACSAATQRQRLCSRGWTLEQIQQRIDAQMPIADKMSRANHVLWNEGQLGMLARQCDLIIPRLA